MHLSTRIRLLLPILLVALFAGVACGDSGADSRETISRDTFVEAWVELRRAALSAEDAILTDSLRDEVLRSVEVTEEELLEFAEVHGEDLRYMRAIWDTIEARLDSVDLSSPSSPSGS